MHKSLAFAEPSSAATAEAAVDRFVEEMGLVAHTETQPRIAGRLFGLCLVDGGTFSLQELARRLKVSRASVSTNARILAEIGILERAAGPDRQDYYRIAPDPYRNLLAGMVRRLGTAHEIIGRAAEAIPEALGGARRRAQDLAEFYRTSAAVIAEIGSRWATRSDPNPPSQD